MSFFRCYRPRWMPCKAAMSSMPFDTSWVVRTGHASGARHLASSAAPDSPARVACAARAHRGAPAGLRRLGRKGASSGPQGHPRVPPRPSCTVPPRRASTNGYRRRASSERRCLAGISRLACRASGMPPPSAHASYAPSSRLGRTWSAVRIPPTTVRCTRPRATAAEGKIGLQTMTDACQKSPLDLVRSPSIVL